MMISRGTEVNLFTQTGLTLGAKFGYEPLLVEIVAVRREAISLTSFRSKGETLK